MIDYAEALTVIDVNSGSFIGRGKAARLEDTITKTNLEAAEEVVNQLRLRDIGGIIVIDFIDMARARNRDAVLKTLRKSLDEDRTKTYVVEISPLGLVEMTRQNVTDGVREIMTRPCPTCDGEGVILSEETIAIEVERKLRDYVKDRDAEAFLVQLNPRVSSQFTGNGARTLLAARAGDGQAVPLRGLRGPAARPLRGDHGGRARGGRGAGAALPRGRGGARPDRRAAHVQRRRRGREDRRLHHRGDRRRRVRRREAARAHRGGRPHGGHRLARGQRRRPGQEAGAQGGRREGRFRRRRARGGHGERRWRKIPLSAPRPQRRTAPFSCRQRHIQHHGRRSRPCTRS